MSKILSPFSLVFGSFLLILQFFTFVDGQDIEATIILDPKLTNLARVDGRFVWAGERRHVRRLSFLREYAGIKGLAERISDVTLRTVDGSMIAFRRATSGEYVTDGDVSNWSYAIDLKPFPNATAAGHISWLTNEGGILFLDDLLPQTLEKQSAKITLVTSVVVKSGEWGDPDSDGNHFWYKDKEKGVLLVGRSPRRSKVFDSAKIRVTLTLTGDWKFSDTEAASMTSEIFSYNMRTFGASPFENVLLSFQKFPVLVGVGNYEADTRGNTITILSSDMPFKSQSVQRLHEQLRHEIVHLWIPNGVNLSGNYDWFYEGFALYESLKLGVAVNRIRFEDFLDTLSRAYDIDAGQAKKLSLIDASKNRWSGANTQVYARGMLVAFLCDLALLENSKGKLSAPTLLREIFVKHRPPAPSDDGNAAVIAVLRNHRELIPIVERYILGAEPLDWAALLKAAGIEAESQDRLTRLKVTAKPSGRQKDMLDKLGYNNWRKLNSK